MKRSAFTLIELLVVIAIIAILAVVVVLTLNPSELLKQSRDASRVSDMATLNSALGLYQTDTGSSMGTSSVVYASLFDPSATSSSPTNCAGLGLPLVPSSFSWSCDPSSTYRSNNNGWIPVNFASLSGGAPFGSLPIDPVNSSSSRLFYSYATNGSQYEVTSGMESSKYRLGGGNDVISSDGGSLSSVYEKGSKLGLVPLDYGDSALAGYWPLTEGSGTVAYDWSGNGNTATSTGSGALTWLQNCRNQSSCLDFTGGGFTRYLTATNTASLNIPGQMTITFWMYPVAMTSGVQMHPIRKWTGTTDANYVVYWFGAGSGSSGTLALDLNVGGVWGGQASVLPAMNGWHFVAYTHTSTGFTQDFDGAISSHAASGNLATSTAPLYIGNDSTDASFYMSNVRIYNRALSTAELQALYTGGR